MANLRATLTHPTARKDDAPFPIGELKHVLLSMKATLATTWSPVGAPMLPGELSRPISNIPGGNYQFRAIWVDTNNRESDPVETPKSVPIAVPNGGTLVIDIVP